MDTFIVFFIIFKLQWSGITYEPTYLTILQINQRLPKIFTKMSLCV